MYFMNLRTSLLRAFAVLMLHSMTLSAAVTFDFDYTAANHFDDTSKASLASAASMVSGFFNHTATISIAITDSNANNNTLASAESSYANAFAAGEFTERGVVAAKILSNGASDPNGGAADGSINVNFYHNWDFDDSIAADAYDFKQTMIHELLHAVGFGSSIEQNGNDSFGTTPGNAAFWEPFDAFVGDKDGAIIDGNGILDATKWNAASVGGTGSVPASDGLYFHGTNAKNANGGNPVPIYSPTTWQSGSSGSHLDGDYYSGANEMLMNASTGTGPGKRTLSQVEYGVLQDIGFTVVPEASHYAVVSGLALTLFALKRKGRSRKHATVNV
jgi:hypothetical protein